MKTQWIKKLSCFMMVVLCLSVFTASAEATLVWSDNFDDEDYVGWTILGYNETTKVSIPGNFSAEGGLLTVLDDDINMARHDSTTNVGTWSFDLYVPDDNDGEVAVNFMTNGTRPYPSYNSKMISVQAQLGLDHFVIWEIRGDQAVVFEAPYIPSGGLAGWYHIDVTRTDAGRFQVFLNNTIVWDFVSNDVTTSTYLEAIAIRAPGAAFDNFIVSDSIDVHTPTPTPTTSAPPEIPYILIAVGAAVVVLFLVAVVFLRRR